MNDRFRNQVVVIVGATGGLGSAFVRAFADAGARLVLASRSEEALKRVLPEIEPQVFPMDMADPASLYALQDYVEETFGRVDVVVNATGVDVRKPFAEHTVADFDCTLDVNLRGAIVLTHAFLPGMRDQGSGNIVHIGGFADGRLAFPYYSVDVATRAGMFSFVESLNRELEGSGAVVTYFSPSPADTDAERPYHPIWREMGTRIVSRERVAATLLDVIDKERRVYVMGGLATRLFANLNAVWPRLADVLLMRRYGKILKQFLT